MKNGGNETMTKFNSEEFYPTPQLLLEKITKDIKWKEVHTVLEPSAGKGDMVMFVQEQAKSAYNRDFDVDCIEFDADLRATLKGKELRVVHDDFLTFKTFKKYDLIIMNPPFSNGAAHLLKALELQKDGGAILCILNAETIRNVCTNERHALQRKLEDVNAEIEFLQGEFATAERPTGVEIAIIKVFIPEKEIGESFIIDNLKKKYYKESSEDITDVAPGDFIEALVARYNLEIESGLKLINEYKAMSPYILNSLKDILYNSPILTLKIGDKELSTNLFVKRVREKYWDALFRNPKFTENMTSNLSSEYHSRVKELSNYDFSLYNIRCIQIEMSRNLIHGIEDCIIHLFDELSHQYSWCPETSRNIHYYDGWQTNKSWIINKRVILPYINSFDSIFRRFKINYESRKKLRDIEMALNYLDGGRTDGRDLEHWLNHYEEIGQTKKCELKYFYVTFYKKGTCHIEFKDEELLKKLNIFGSQQKGWLPQGYGKKKYDEFNETEKEVVESFEGKRNYEKTLAQRDYFIYNPKNSVLGIEMSA